MPGLVPDCFRLHGPPCSQEKACLYWKNTQKACHQSGSARERQAKYHRESWSLSKVDLYSLWKSDKLFKYGEFFLVDLSYI